MRLHETAFATTWEELRSLARERGVKKSDQRIAHCLECGVTESLLGLSHWPDCSADPDRVRFIPKEAG